MKKISKKLTKLLSMGGFPVLSEITKINQKPKTMRLGWKIKNYPNGEMLIYYSKPRLSPRLSPRT